MPAMVESAIEAEVPALFEGSKQVLLLGFSNFLVGVG